MYGSRSDSLPTDSRRSGHGRLLVLVAVTMLAVPVIVIAWLTTLPDRDSILVACRGTVLVNGQPLTSGKIISRKTDAQPSESNSTAIIDAHGKFQMTTDGQPGTLPGHHHLAVLSDARIGGIEIPEKYRSLKTTPQAIDVQLESHLNVFTINIKVDD